MSRSSSARTSRAYKVICIDRQARQSPRNDGPDLTDSTVRTVRGRISAPPLSWRPCSGSSTIRPRLPDVLHVHLQHLTPHHYHCRCGIQHQGQVAWRERCWRGARGAPTRCWHRHELLSRCPTLVHDHTNITEATAAATSTVRNEPRMCGTCTVRCGWCRTVRIYTHVTNLTST